MRENRPYGLEGGEAGSTGLPYPYACLGSLPGRGGVWWHENGLRGQLHGRCQLNWECALVHFRSSSGEICSNAPSRVDQQFGLSDLLEISIKNTCDGQASREA